MESNKPLSRLIETARIKILVVPVGRIRQSTFSKYVELLQKFNVISLGDVTPETSGNSKPNKFRPQIGDEGHMYFNYVTTYDREAAPLEELQMHQSVMGVIGIMNCQEHDKMGEGYEQFMSKVLPKYPTALANRCFAFEPNEGHEDNTKGIVVIPNVGQMDFYMNTMICDFASDLLSGFGNLVVSIECRSVINSPPSNTLGQPASAQANNPSAVSTPSQSFVNTSTLTLPGTPTNINISSPSAAIMSPAATASAAVTGVTNMMKDMPNPSQMGNMLMSPEARLKKRTPGRAQKLIADLYLMAGRLQEAIAGYVTAVETTKSNIDYLWQASALEGYYIALLLLSYSKTGLPSSLPTLSTTSETDSISSQTGSTSSNTINLLEIQEKYKEIISLYEKAGAPLLVIQSAVKVARLLADLLESPLFKTTNILANRVEIVGWLSLAWASGVEGLYLSDQVRTALSLAALYSRIGYHRKQSFFLRYAASILLPIISRKVVTGKDAANSNTANALISGNAWGLLDVMKRICHVFGVGSHLTYDDDNFEFGWPELQIDVLRESIRAAEAVEDPTHMITFTTRLLRRLHPYLSRDEQIKIATSLQRVVAASLGQEEFTDGVKSTLADTVLLKGVFGVPILKGLEVLSPSLRRVVFPNKRQSRKVEATVTQSNDPFIFNPYSKKSNSVTSHLLVAKEPCYANVTFTNPFSFDLEIQSISISTSGVPFEAIPVSTVIPASTSNHVVRVSGIPLDPGTLTIRGCIVKVFGCVEQEYLSSDLAEQDTKNKERKGALRKIKRSGLDNLEKSVTADKSKQPKEPKFKTLTVIEPQPLLKLKSTDAVFNSIMLFEGETTSFDLVLENIGETPIDLVSLVFSESKIGDATLPSDSSPVQVYEFESYEKNYQLFRWVDGQKDVELGGKRVNVMPGEEFKVTVNVYGKRARDGGTIKIQYAYLDRSNPTSGIEETVKDIPTADTFHTREMTIPVVVTIVKPFELFNMDTMLFRSSAAKSLKNGQDKNSNELYGQEEKDGDKLNGYLLSQSMNVLMLGNENGHGNGEIDGKANNKAKDYCLFTFDIRNLYMTGFELNFCVDDLEKPCESETIIQPGSTKRVVLPIRRIYLPPEKSLQPIPIVNQKQFVVSKKAKLTESEERDMKMLFWYKEALLKKIKVSWRCSDKRKGTLDLRSLSLTKSMLNILRTDEVTCWATLIDVDSSTQLEKTGENMYRLKVGQSTAFSVHVHNHLDLERKLCLRVQPVLDCQNGEIDNDLGDRILWQGTLQTMLPKISRASKYEHSIPMLRPASLFALRTYASAVQPSTLVVVEHKDSKVLSSTLNAVTAAQKLGKPISFFVASSSASDAAPIISELKKYSPSSILVAPHASFKNPALPEIISPLIAKAQKSKGFSHVVAPHSAFGKNVMPRVAALLDVAQVSDIIGIEGDDTFVRPIYAGNAICKVKSKDPVKIVTVRGTAFPVAAPGGESDAKVEEIKEDVKADSSEFVKEELQKSDRPELGAARVVIGGGRGMKNGDNFKILYELADKLGGTVGASRAAVDAGFVDNSLQIGQTGKVIAPELYIAVGISGAIQHLAGMKDSKTIVAVNKDPEAPIFQIADYGLVDDLFKVVPDLTQKI
ncbi:transport protein Trs120 or TRAPPC9 TRAPP II complex subunit-domain-containing protein [Paraphysoderma sedebokerense]|nr:transport protein Trs120 or TRAPPC9 TRAPP II complex subunit-domain-containing protein [Paraphysoderma sedebokerense]